MSNKVPIYYSQKDSRWAGIPYATQGESASIGSAGCGPTCMAMVIASLKDKSVTPKTTAAWSVAHGYKAYKQGTYYSYFAPQGKAYGLTVKQLNSASVYGKPNDASHAVALNHVKNGGWVIACMGKGTWTSSGHFVLWHDYNGKALIKDPASTATARTQGNYATFKSQVKYYFLVTVPGDKVEVKGADEVTYEEFKRHMQQYEAEKAKAAADAYAKDALAWAKKSGLLKGDQNGNLMPKSNLTREDMAVILQRFAEAQESDV